MLFCTSDYLRFLSLVVLLYWAMPRFRYRDRLRVWLLIAASVYFYASWSESLAGLVLATTVVDYLIARGMDSFSSRAVRRTLLVASLGMNLGVLVWFKYVGFFLDALREMAARGGFESSLPILEVILPFGISFYTFEAISYAVDVYRGRIRAETRLDSFVLFILFFPHLVAGPIVRGRDFLPQTHRPKVFSPVRFRYGVLLLTLGGAMKMLFADRFAMYADPVFADPGAYKTVAVWMALLAQTLRIFCDFAGYSAMALGSAHLLGYRLTVNFNSPYLSADIREFWKRWHMSLSSWLRDYLFIPLGGSRGSSFATCRNLLVTMTLGGLWHGAAAAYVLWGVYHGLLLIAHRAIAGRLPLGGSVGRAISTATTFVCVMLGWVLFQPSLDSAATMYTRLLTPCAGAGLPMASESLLVLIALTAVGHWLGASLPRTWWRRVDPLVLGIGCGLTWCVVLVLAPPASPPFVYFRF